MNKKSCINSIFLVKYFQGDDMMSLGHDILMVVIGLIVGIVIGFFGARIFMKKYLKKNPPINEEMIKGLMMQMGRKPNQKQINQMMKNMQKYM